MADSLRLREAHDGDAPGLISLIGSVFSEYDGCVLDLPSLDHDLLAIHSTVRKLNGKFWVAEREGAIVGSIGFTELDPETLELKRLYVAKVERKQGLGQRLYELVLNAARERKAKTIELWSDTRFKDAHAFYQKRGFLLLPETRALNDPSNSIEYHFVKTL